MYINIIPLKKKNKTQKKRINVNISYNNKKTTLLFLTIRIDRRIAKKRSNSNNIQNRT